MLTTRKGNDIEHADVNSLRHSSGRVVLVRKMPNISKHVHVVV